MTTYLDSEKGGEEKEIENKMDGKGGRRGKGEHKNTGWNKARRGFEKGGCIPPLLSLQFNHSAASIVISAMHSNSVLYQ